VCPQSGDAEAGLSALVYEVTAPWQVTVDRRRDARSPRPGSRWFPCATFAAGNQRRCPLCGGLCRHPGGDNWWGCVFSRLCGAAAFTEPVSGDAGGCRPWRVSGCERPAGGYGVRVLSPALSVASCRARGASRAIRSCAAPGGGALRRWQGGGRGRCADHGAGRG
jgi:hypothetical protein